MYMKDVAVSNKNIHYSYKVVGWEALKVKEFIRFLITLTPPQYVCSYTTFNCQDCYNRKEELEHNQFI